MMKTVRICLAAGVIGAFGQALAQEPAAGAAAGQTAPAAVVEKKDPARAVADIQRALRDEKEVPAGRISVAVHADTVVLSGEVDSESQAARAMSLAQQHAGDVRVSSHVEVRPKTTGASEAEAAASALVREVESALKQDRRTASLGVAVSVDEQQVIGLHGLVPSRESRAAAEEVAAGVDGVRRVSSHLVVPGE